MRFRYDDQIAAQPDAVEQVLAQPPAPALDPARPVVLTGSGTSLHACRVAAAWLDELRGMHARAVDAHELALRLPIRARDQVIAVTHRGRRGFTQAALDRARSVGAATIAVVGRGAPQPRADHVLRTCPEETAETHTVSYVTALAQLARLTGDARLAAALATVPGLLRDTIAQDPPVGAARRIARREPVLVAGFGTDAITAAEGALKLKEATFVWAEGFSIEQALHGPLAAARPGMAAIVVLPARDDAGRAQRLRTALERLGVETLSCGAPGEDLTFAACDELVRPLLSIVPLQRLAAEIARATGGDPDRTRLDVDPWKSALA